MKMTIKDTIKLQEKLMKRYCSGDADREIIRDLCFARNVAEMVQEHYEKTHNKTEFYRAILNDSNMSFSMGYQTLYKYYPHLKG